MKPAEKEWTCWLRADSAIQAFFLPADNSTEEEKAVHACELKRGSAFGGITRVNFL